MAERELLDTYQRGLALQADPMLSLMNVSPGAPPQDAPVSVNTPPATVADNSLARDVPPVAVIPPAVTVSVDSLARPGRGLLSVAAPTGKFSFSCGAIQRFSPTNRLS